MKKTMLLFMFCALCDLNLRAEDAAKTHTVIMNNFQNDSFKMRLESKTITTNGDREAGLYFPSVTGEKELGFDSGEAWVKKPEDKESRLLAKYYVEKAQKSLPLRIIFKKRKAKEASEIVARLLRSSPDQLQFIFSATMGESQLVPMKTTVDALDSRDPSKAGELSYQAMEFKVNETAVKIKNVKTGHVITLTDYIDGQIDRSAKTALKKAIKSWFSKDKSDVGIKDSGRSHTKESSDQNVKPQNDSNSTTR